MASQLRFDDRVVLITGAGGGLGRAYALFFGSRGAKVVVNDLGRNGGPSKSADETVELIKQAGGQAVANYDSVENGDRIVQTAIDNFKKIDIVINNAGILRDVSFAKMTDADWKIIQDIHVRGSYKVTKAAWKYMQDQKFGRIINTASAAGIYGNYGQANYSAAKLALYGFSTSLAREGARRNIFVNAIAPIAASKMTETVLPKEVLAHLNPDFVVPLVAYLCHESTSETGQLFEVGAGFVSKLRYERSKGAVFKADSSFTPGAVMHRLEEIESFDEPTYPSSITETDWVGLLESAKHIEKNPSSETLTFKDRVAVVTGAGNGLGRAYALLFGKLGASVVVNDLKSRDGSSSPADAVVKTITEAGGKAVASYDSVEAGDKIIETAIKAFGRVDIVVNNAGILRDKSFIKATDDDWDMVQRVHLNGTYKVTKAAWPYMIKQKFGRIINTTSAVGLYGNFGQVNYSSAKSGIIAFSRTLALEGNRSNILVNAIAPNAGTAMTATVMPPEMVEALKPDYIAPLVAFLGHEKSEVTGSIFEVGSGWIAKVRWQRTGGYGFPVNRKLLPEHIQEKFAEICDFEDGRATWPENVQEAFMGAQSNFENVAEGEEESPSGNAQHEFGEASYDVTEKEIILYALGVGAKRKDLAYVYENSSEFQALPTFAVIPAFHYQNEMVPFGDFLKDYNPVMVLHAEQFVEFYNPMPTNGKLVSTGRIVDILDKGKTGGIAVIEVLTKDDEGRKICRNQFSFLCRSSGNFGGKRVRDVKGPETAENAVPDRKPDTVVREVMPEDIAAIYRLTADLNPLHIDPEVASMAGYKVPIIHGLLTFGMSGKHVFQTYGNGSPNAFKNIKARFAKPTLPGDTIETRMWRDGNKVTFQTVVVERNEVVIASAAVELNEAKSKL